MLYELMTGTYHCKHYDVREVQRFRRRPSPLKTNWTGTVKDLQSLELTWEKMEETVLDSQE